MNSLLRCTALVRTLIAPRIACQVPLAALALAGLTAAPAHAAQDAPALDVRTATAKWLPIADAWSGTSINAVVFRRNSVASRDGAQYVAFYDTDSRVCLAKRSLPATEWEVHTTQYRGNTADAHNSISLIVDGNGLLHISWDHHGHPLRYAQGKAPGSLELTGKLSMTGKKEGKVTYPEFYTLPDGGLIFLYRDGSSGAGDLMMNRYDSKSGRWTQVQDAFVDGEGERNAYWQMCTDKRGTIHLSWVWRETTDVATNHDMAYACSKDGGVTWLRSNGDAYKLPITQATAEYAALIPQGHDLMNTTSMCADAGGRPYIATYFRSEGSDIPQYQLIFHDGEAWQTTQISDRQTPFTLGGSGTRRIPISRCQIFVREKPGATLAYLLFRDAERGSRVSLATTASLGKLPWTFSDLTEESVDMWEPSYDTELWRSQGELHVFVQRVGQGNRDTAEDVGMHPAGIIEVDLGPPPSGDAK